jgi:DNA-binding response OmpR family regulator
VKLPLEKISSTLYETVISPANGETDTIVEDSTISKSADKLQILLVDDNDDFRLYLKDNLRISYDVMEAKTGEEGWKKVVSKYPDLIIANWVMPDMRGTDLCRRIKTDQRVNCIPVILISSCSCEAQWLEGFEAGAEAYISKPFSIPVLMLRIRNLISLRKKIKSFIEMEDSRGEGTMPSSDNIFIREVVRVIERNIANNELTVSGLSHELGLSRAQFFRKVQQLTGKSPLELIRGIRLQHAAQLLERSQLTVSEITCRVGFVNAKYFARLFKKQYHVLPSEYASGKRKDY